MADTRDELLKAATQVFSQKGFSGARVDEIASRAKANKAMIYYHFGPKEDLYQAVLLHLFGQVIAVLEEVERAGLAPPERLSTFYRRVADLFRRDSALAFIMAREALEGGRHLTPETAQVFSRILGFVAAAIEQGAAAGQLRRVHPLTLHLSMIAPLFLFFAGEAFRNRIWAAAAPPDLKPPDTQGFLDYLDHTLARGLAPGSDDGAAPRAAEEKA
jgi:TetR/AcrR family transcriptional regulator